MSSASASATADRRGPGIYFPPPFYFVSGYLAGWGIDRLWPSRVIGELLGGARMPLGWLGIAIGMFWMAWGFLTFLRARTAVIPHHPATRLVASGPYRRTRNPMYLGFVFLYVGVSIATDRAWALVVLPVVVALLVAIVIRKEERYLTAKFGQEYEAFRRRVRRWL